MQIRTFQWKLMFSKTGLNNNFNFVVSVGGRQTCQQVRRCLHSKQMAEWVNKLTEVLKSHIAENKTARIWTEHFLWLQVITTPVEMHTASPCLFGWHFFFSLFIVANWHDLCSVIFSWMPIGWLCTRTLLNMYRTHGTEQGWEAVHFLWTLSVTVHFLCS